MNRIYLVIAALLIFVYDSRPVQSHSVAQVQTAKRISRSTVVLLDPQGSVGGSTTSSDTLAEVGDVLTFVFQFTPVPNDATRGAGGYITEYVPRNMRVVGARIIDRDGNTIAPQRGPQMNEGYGPRGRHNNYDTTGFLQGSMTQLYADTGIFYSVDASTLRTPSNTFITVENGLLTNPSGTGVGKLEPFVGVTTGDDYAHNQWDLTQLYAFGVDKAVPSGYVRINSDGKGNAPFGYGSPVAGPDTFYPCHAVPNPACSDGMGVDFPDAGCASVMDNDETAASDCEVGPWNRVRYAGSEIGQGAATDCSDCCATAPTANCAGQNGPVRVGTPTSAGHVLSRATPLPWCDPAAEPCETTNAVRFAVGELIVGQEYFAEISLEVMELPLDPSHGTSGADVNCSEVFGGDAAQPQKGQDNTWRYFLPSPACVALNNFFELNVDSLVAQPPEVLTYKIEGKNLSVNDQDNVVVIATFDPGDLDQATFAVVPPTPAPDVFDGGAGTAQWNVGTLTPGQAYEFEYTLKLRAGPANTATLHKANYQSTQLAVDSPEGFTVVAFTDIEEIVVGALDMSVDNAAPTAGDTIRYTATFTNTGTADATTGGASFVEVTLPNDISFCGTAGGCLAPTMRTFDALMAPTSAGDVVTDPSGTSGGAVTYWNFGDFNTANTVLERGGYLQVEFDAKIDGAAVGLYTGDVQIQVGDAGGIGKDVELFTVEVAEVLVGVTRTATPTVNSPIAEGSSTVTGTATDGADVIVYVNGEAELPAVVATGGVYTKVIPYSLFAGLGISATAELSPALISLASAEVFVEGVGTVTACNDGIDNDMDGKTDFDGNGGVPDPGCLSGLDPDETDVPQCADGIDNDSAGGTDYPNDPSCSSFADNSEDGVSECDDGIDNDGDGFTDFDGDGTPADADPDCTGASDSNEGEPPACSNGEDDDNDGKVDYPADPGCTDASDQDEADVATSSDAGVGDPDAGGGPGSPDAGVGLGSDAGTPTDPGGVDAPGGGGGCCSVADSKPWSGLPGGLVLMLACLLVLRRREDD